MMNNKFVIIGSSAAALGCINGIRKFNMTDEITVISKDSKIIYSKPVIAEILGNSATEKSLVYIYSEKLIKDNKINFIENTEVTEINTSDKILKTAVGREIKFAKLLIGAGGAPIIPPVKICETVKDSVFTFTNLQDLNRLKEKLPAVKSAIIVGAGFIGLELADALHKNNIEVKIVELAERPLIKTADAYISEIVARQFKKAGIEIITDNSVVEILKNNNNYGSAPNITACLKSGRRVDADIIIFAIGVKPDLRVVKNSGIKTNFGIIIDETAATNIKDIYAAGDITEIPDITTGNQYPIALWNWAFEAGFTAGANMTGITRKFSGGFPMSPLKFAKFPIVSVGDVNSNCDEILLIQKEKRNIYEKICIRDNKIVGYILTGKSIGKSGLLTELIKKRRDIRQVKDKLQLPDFSIADIPIEWRNSDEQ